MKTKEEKKTAREQVCTITRKIEIKFINEDYEERKELHKELFDIRYNVFKAANHLMNHLYFNKIFLSKIKESDEFKMLKSDDDRVREKDIVEEVYNTSLQNSGYREITNKYPELNSRISTSLNSKVTSKFNSDLKEVMSGSKSLSNYKLGMPIPFNANGRDIRKEKKDGNDEFLFFLSNRYQFKIFFGRDKSDNATIVERVFSGEYKMCDSEIELDGTKMFLLLTFQHQKQTVKLDYGKIAATNLGMNCPIMLTCNDVSVFKRGNHLSIGTKEEFWKVRTQIKERYSRLQKSLITAKSGHGRDRKLKALDILKKVEANFAKTYNHKLSKRLIMFCVNNGIGTINTEDLLGAGSELCPKYVLRFWSYYQLQSFIEYKAKMYNIRVVKVSPIDITKKCTCCGNISEKSVNLQTRMYSCVNEECINFSRPIDIDYNASLNVLKA